MNDVSNSDIALCFAPGTPGYNPTWHALAHTGIYWDPAGEFGGNDNNTGAPGSPVLTWSEIVRRFGSDSPTLTPGASVIVNKLSAQSANVDPVFFFPRVSNGGYAALIDTLVVFSGPISAGTVTLVNQIAGTDLTVTGMPAGTTAGMLIFNSTRDGYAFVSTIIGDTATICQPLSAALCTTIGLPTFALGADWQIGDALIVYAIPNSTNLKAWRPNGGDVAVGGAASVGWVQFTQIADSSTDGSSDYPMVCDCASSVLSCCYVEPRLNMSALVGRIDSIEILNCYMAGYVFGFNGSYQIWGGTIVGNFTNESVSSVNNIGGNCIIQGQTTIEGILQSASAHFIGDIEVSAAAVLKVSSTGSPWGQAAVRLGAQSAFHFTYTPASWVTAYLLTGTMSFNRLTTGTYFNPATGLWSTPVTVNPANLDAAPGVAGAIMDAATGARFCCFL